MAINPTSLPTKQPEIKRRCAEVGSLITYAPTNGCLPPVKIKTIMEGFLLLAPAAVSIHYDPLYSLAQSIELI